VSLSHLWVVASLTLVACSKPETTQAVPSASASAAPAPPPPPPPPSNEPVAWSGPYTSAPGSLYVYDGGEWKGVHFRGDDASAALGDGTLALTIDPKTHEVHGTGSGPIGDVILTGAVTGEELSFTVLRKDPKDRGLTGTGVGKLSDAAATGSIHLSAADAHVIREAKFTLAKTKS
jgi:hypothetical protein